MECKLNHKDCLNARSAYTKEELVQLLTDVYSSDQVIIGQETPVRGKPNTVQITLDEFKECTKTDLALLGIDIRQTNLDELGENGIKQVLKELIAYASKGGLITVSAHFMNPTIPNPTSHDYRGWIGKDEEWAKLITPGTDTNTVLKKELSNVADFLEVLKDHGVPVIWRMLHEENCNWFWWCMMQEWGKYTVTEESYRNLWIYIHDYFTKERGLTNLIWEFCPDIKGDSSGYMHVLTGYPGDEYVDILAFDWYTNRNDYERVNTLSTYDELTKLGKIVNIAEFGPGGEGKAENPADQPELFSSVDVLKFIERFRDEGKHFAYVLAWVDSWSIKTMGHGDELMKSDLTLSLEDINQKLNEIRRKRK